MSISILNTDAGLSGTTLLNAESTQTITGSKTFDLDPSAPFVVTSGSAVVTNLDADKLDGQEGSYYTNATNISSGTLSASRLPTGAVQLLSRTTAAQTVSNSAAENTLLTYTLPGGTLSTNRMLRITLKGRLTNTTGSAQNFRIMTRYDGTTLIGANNISCPDNVTEDMVYQVHLWANDSASAQIAMGRITGVHSAGGTGWNSTAASANNIGDQIEFNGTGVKNSSNPLDITIVVQLGVASASLVFISSLIMIELI